MKVNFSKLAVKTSNFLSTWEGKMYRCYWCNTIVFELGDEKNEN